MKPLLLLSLSLALPLSSLRADWLNFRGPAGSGFDPGIATTVGELAEKTLAWKAALPGRGLGSPIVVGDKVFVTAASGPEQQQLHVLCFSAKDGTPLWERRFWATGRTMSHNKTNVAAPTPASDGERIYALYSSNDLVCLDLDGDLVWMRGLTLDYPNASNSLGMASSPIVVGDTLVAQIENDSESFAAGFDLLTGMNKWKLDRPKSANWTSPTVLNMEGESIVALQSGEGVVGLVPSTGSTVFSIPEKASTIPSAAASGDELFIPANGLTVMKLGGAGEEPKKVWNQTNQRPGTPSVLVGPEKLFLINNAGVLTCASRRDGTVAWEIRLKGPFSGSPVAGGDGKLYIFSEQGVGQVVDTSGEKGVVASE
ncbi:MAG: PQQ-binding-like beta-propeller repeat protein, partial [Verrucomicrobia bacterium]|nr:PQQ-binding-like beta-propeller repeat protein [Verrucomicrobiota bacterium]